MKYEEFVLGKTKIYGLRKDFVRSRANSYGRRQTRKKSEIAERRKTHSERLTQY